MIKMEYVYDLGFMGVVLVEWSMVRYGYYSFQPGLGIIWIRRCIWLNGACLSLELAPVVLPRFKALIEFGWERRYITYLFPSAITSTLLDTIWPYASCITYTTEAATYEGCPILICHIWYTLPPSGCILSWFLTFLWRVSHIIPLKRLALLILKIIFLILLILVAYLVSWSIYSFFFSRHHLITSHNSLFLTIAICVWATGS